MTCSPAPSNRNGVARSFSGLVFDSLAHSAGAIDKIIGKGDSHPLLPPNYPTPTFALRACGAGRAVLRAAFGLEMMAHVARERGTAFPDSRRCYDRR